jgi:CRP/FNR family transcriptional regulator
MNSKSETRKTPEEDLKNKACESISKSVFFQGLSPESIAHLAQVAVWKRFEAKQTIFNSADPVVGFHLVASGLVRIYLSDPSGRDRTIHLCGPGVLFGEAAIFLPGGYPASAAAVCRSETLLFPAKAFKDLITQKPDLSLAIIGVMAQRLNHFREIIESAIKALLPRLAGFLLELNADEGKIVLPTTKVQLAKRLGTTAESLSRAFGRLKNAGLLMESKPYLVITDRSRLQAVAEGLLGV